MKPERFTLRAAIADLGWFSATFAALVGGPSVLALLQMIFVEHRLIDALQWIVDGYNDIVAVLGAVVEPALQPALQWLNDTFGWRLALQPHWRPLFLLAIIPASSLARDSLRPKTNADRSEPIALGVGAVLGVGVAALVPLAGGWWAHGLMASAPVAAMLLTAAAVGHVRNLLAKPINRTPFAPGSVLGPAFLFAAVAFALGAGLSFAPGLRNGAGMIALGALIVLAGASTIVTAAGELRTTASEANANVAAILHRDYTDMLRNGVTMLGGFVAAGMILAADAGVKALGA